MSNQYAHLLSSAVAAKAKEVDGGNNAKPMKGESEPANDKEDGKKAKSESEEEDEDEGKEKEKKEDKEEDKETEREDKEDKKGKKSKASSGLSSAEAQAVQLEERLRCATIFQSKAAAGRPDLAARFAFHTNLSADESILLMEGFSAEAPAAPRRQTIDERMANVPSANVGSDVVESAEGQEAGVTEAQLAKMSPDQKALMIVNASRRMRGEAPLSKLS